MVRRSSLSVFQDWAGLKGGGESLNGRLQNFILKWFVAGNYYAVGGQLVAWRCRCSGARLEIRQVILRDTCYATHWT